ncbi:MAG: Na+/H+ antiporter subunit D [Alphaproteobacteria bacterium]|nr:Na+/H+ antiporter subunit D [Alphaproteobacteria bacterium]MBU0799207.1 Na+/H+ antiporter subunit D [Alphaproteobacteria bacterium]MBU0887542.1 Na+/H+ antiporter subunit D [Alphaproteobacteria bacterium]MBU1814779.1 Na+/H+ antiporter subunit D [Alphaproteobacteria bacterium]MBU2089680.1 Na+/H+ antiporter subunit D [Alphaproteobacteria bacterium]
MQLLLIAPLLIPLCAAGITAIFWSRPDIQRPIGLAAACLLLGSSVALLSAAWAIGPLVGQMGGWRAPFGITIIIDVFSAIMLVITGLMAVAVAIYAMGPGAVERDKAGFQPLFHSLILGVAGAFSTGDIFNLYVWFEVMLIASFGLLVLDRTREQIDGGLRYVMLNLVGTIFFLMGVGLLYGLTGTLNLADIARLAPEIENQGALAAVGVLLLIAFGAKAAVFPIFNWLPAAYHTASMPVAAIFAALLTKVGVYAIIRVFTLIFAHDTAFFGPIIGVIAMATMVTGVFGAASHYDVRRILSFHIISQIGYMLVGIALMTPLAIAGSVFYVVHHIIVKANLFLIAGVIREEGGFFGLRRLGGLWVTKPLLGLLFLIPALSLAGLPPLSGFWGKFAVIRAGLEAEAYILAGVALSVGLLTLFSMIKIWNEAFWKAAPVAPTGTVKGDEPPATRWTRRERAASYVPIMALAALTLTIGLWTEPFAALSMAAAEGLLDRQGYIEAVLGTPQLAELTGGVE